MTCLRCLERANARRQNPPGSDRASVSKFLWRGYLQHRHFSRRRVRPSACGIGELAGRMGRRALPAHHRPCPCLPPVLQPGKRPPVHHAMGLACSSVHLDLRPVVGHARLGRVPSGRAYCAFFHGHRADWPRLRHGPLSFRFSARAHRIDPGHCPANCRALHPHRQRYFRRFPVPARLARGDQFLLLPHHLPDAA